MEQIQEDVVYIIECLVQDYTGEAKGEIGGLIDTINAMEALDTGYREALLASLGKILRELRVLDPDGNARSELVTLRRKITNTRMQLLGATPKYNYADPLTAKDR